MVFTRKDGDFHGRTVSLPEGNGENKAKYHIRPGNKAEKTRPYYLNKALFLGDDGG